MNRPFPGRERRPRHDPGQDFLILIIIVLCTVFGAKLVVELMTWNRLQTCVTAGYKVCSQSLPLISARGS